MSITLQVLNGSGQPQSQVVVEDQYLEHEKGEQAVHDTVVAYMASLRGGTHDTKTRAEVRGGGAKPWRQKGTGRARHGSIRSPIWRGGGIAWGPHPRSYDKKVNKKVRKLALKRAFTERLNEGAVVVVDQVVLGEARTKAATALLKTLGVGENVLVIAEARSRELDLATRNLPDVYVTTPDQVHTYLVLLYRKVLITAGALKQLGERLA